MSTEKELEHALRSAPRPIAPPGLKQTLLEDISLPGRQHNHSEYSSQTGSRLWFLRWWPALGAGCASLACAVVVGVQQTEIRELQETLDALKPLVSSETVDAEAAFGPGTSPATAEEELALLKQRIASLSAEIERLEALMAENSELTTQLNAGSNSPFASEDVEALMAAREKALTIQCLNNLKQLGLAAHIHANAHGDTFPEDVASMAKEVSTPRLLVCPADSGRQAADTWTTFTPANMSYEYLMAGAAAFKEPNRVMFRCPVHGSIAIGDGSAHAKVAKTSPELLKERDGHLYYERQQ